MNTLLFRCDVDALDNENLLRAVLQAYGWELHVHYALEPLRFHRITATNPDAPFDVIVEYVSTGQWARQIRIEWHCGGTHLWPVGNPDDGVPPFDTFLDTRAATPITTEAQLAQLCGGIDLRDVA